MTLSILTTSSSFAKVRDTGDIADCLASVGLHYSNWLLIEEDTLKAIKADAVGYKDSLIVLAKCQEKYAKGVGEGNQLRQSLYDTNRELYNTQLRVYELEHPPWYKQPLLWGAVGVAVGATLGVLGVNGVGK